MKCAKCGYRRQERDNDFVPPTECPACGVIYAKHEHESPEYSRSGTAIASAELKPSPVDAESLKKARDRVEMRLRKKMEASVRDDRHAQTLKLARRFAQEEIRKRQAEKKAKRTEESIEPQSTQENRPVPDPTPEAAPQPMSSETAPIRSQAPPAAATESDPVANAPFSMEIERQESSKAELSGIAGQEEEATAETTPDEPADGRMPSSGYKFTDDGSSFQEADAVNPPDPEDSPAEAQETSAVSMAAIPAAASAARRQGPTLGSGMVRLLSVVAWLFLCTGIIGAILSWTTIGDVEAGMRIPVPESLTALPLGLLLGFAYLATGALGFAFFWVSSIISRQLKDIRQLLMLQPGLMTAGSPVEAPDDQIRKDDSATA